MTGIMFKCADGHKWESAVGGVWLQMPWCPECERTKGKRLPAVAWIGKWDTPTLARSRLEWEWKGEPADATVLRRVAAGGAAFAHTFHSQAGKSERKK